MIEVGDYVYHVENPDTKLRVTSVGVSHVVAVEEKMGAVLKRPSAEFELWSKEVNDD